MKNFYQIRHKDYFKSMYQHTPTFLQHLILSIGAFLRYKNRYGRIFFENLKEIENFQKLTFEEMQRFQDIKFRNLIQYVNVHVPFYRELFAKLKINVDKIDGIDAIKYLPILTKEDIRLNWFCCISDDFQNTRKSIVWHTSGSSGKPLSIVLDKQYY